jgi:hypothetical protein
VRRVLIYMQLESVGLYLWEDVDQTVVFSCVGIKFSGYEPETRRWWGHDENPKERASESDERIDVSNNKVIP